jgi:predicted transcriptional regulator
VRPGEFRLVAALAEEPNGLTYTELKKKANLSNPVISEYLFGLKKLGIILLTPENKKRNERARYTLTSVHQKMDNLPSTFEKRIQIVIREIPGEGIKISLVKDEKLKKEIYNDFIRYHMDNISLLILRSMRNSVSKNLLNSENLRKDVEYNREIPKLTKKKAMGFAKEVCTDWERRMTNYNAEIQGEMLNWVVPYIQMLSLAYMANLQFVSRASLENELTKRFEKETVEKSFWFKKLEEKEKELAKKSPEYAGMRKELLKLREDQYKETTRS